MSSACSRVGTKIMRRKTRFGGTRLRCVGADFRSARSLPEGSTTRIQWSTMRKESFGWAGMWHSMQFPAALTGHTAACFATLAPLHERQAFT